MKLQERWKELSQSLDEYLVTHLNRSMSSDHPAQTKLRESVLYSISSGGKRFRPFLCVLTAELLKIPIQRVMPVAAALEMIHTYSLIHDDLPSMDNDEVRRGKATNHVVFGEAIALLAGNALLTEAFHIISEKYSDEPELALELVRLFSESSGFKGMLSGQAIDITEEEKEQTVAALDYLHMLKTGALIRLSVLSAAKLTALDLEQETALRKYAEYLGLAFQIADDILDYDPSSQEVSNYCNVLGVEESKSQLSELTQVAIKSLGEFGEEAYWLKELALYNQSRIN